KIETESPSAAARAQTGQRQESSRCRDTKHRPYRLNIRDSWFFLVIVLMNEAAAKGEKCLALIPHSHSPTPINATPVPARSDPSHTLKNRLRPITYSQLARSQSATTRALPRQRAAEFAVRPINKNDCCFPATTACSGRADLS